MAQQYPNRRDDGGRARNKALAALAGIAGLLALFGPSPSSLVSVASPAASLRRGLEAVTASSHRGSGPSSSFGYDEEVEFDTVMLLGIFSDPTENGARRRRLIRDTYLREAREDRTGRYCQLSDYVKSRTAKGSRRCQVVYTFVVGGADEHNGPTGLEAENESRSMVLDPPRGEESDVTYLNVREPTSPEDGAGKTAAWFRYASSSQQISPAVDYVSKVDSTTVLSMPLLLDTVVHDLPPAPYNTMHYGGRLQPNLATGDVHAQGSFYLASPDLALHAASKLSDTQWRVDAAQKLTDAAKTPTAATEDALFGAAVFGHVNPIKVITLAERVFWRSNLNSDEEWVNYWKNEAAGELPRRERVMPMREWCAGWFESGALQRKEMKWLKQQQEEQ